jgi:aerobic carbon-monoxide dehydrogenase medium subunit
MARDAGATMTSAGYAAPRTVQDAVALLASTPRARVLAGGQGLLVEPSRSRLAGTLLVDLRQIPTLAGVGWLRDGSLKIGAMTTLAAMTADDALKSTWPALAEAARGSGDAQVRNRGTLGGTLAAADPQSDLPPVLLALDARIEVAGSAGSRTLESTDLYTGAGQTSLRPDDIITAVVIPARGKRTGIAYEKFLHPATLGAICGVAVHLALADNRTLADARVALTGAVDRPLRVVAAEKALTGQPPSDDLLAKAARTTNDAGTFLSDHFASAEYRRHLAGVLTARALKRAMQEAAGQQ